MLLFRPFEKFSSPELFASRLKFLDGWFLALMIASGLKNERNVCLLTLSPLEELVIAFLEVWNALIEDERNEDEASMTFIKNRNCISPIYEYDTKLFAPL